MPLDLTSAYNDVQLTVPSLNGDVGNFCNAGNISSVALLVVDLQSGFCDSEYFGSRETELAAERTASLLPHFRRAGIPVYLIHFGQENGYPGFYKIEPMPSDIIVSKNHESAFQGSDIDRQLRGNGHNILLVCGVYRECCIENTVCDALGKNYDVYLLSDLTGDIQPCKPAETELSFLRSKGAIITTSDDILRTISKVRWPSAPLASQVAAVKSHSQPTPQ